MCNGNSRKRRKRGEEKYWSNNIWRFSEIDNRHQVQIKEAQKTPIGINFKNPTPRHIIFKVLEAKNKEKIMEKVREKRQLTYKGKRIRITLGFVSNTV